MTAVRYDIYVSDAYGPASLRPFAVETYAELTAAGARFARLVSLLWECEITLVRREGEWSQTLATARLNYTAEYSGMA